MLQRKVLLLSQKYTDSPVDIANLTLSALIEGNLDITCAYLKGYPDEHGALPQQRVHYHYFRFSDRQISGLHFNTFKKIYQLCRDRDIDTVITHRFKSCQIIAMLSYFLPLKIHLAVFHSSGGFKRLYRKFFVKYFMRKTQVIAVSQALRQHMLSAKCGLRSDQVSVVYNAINVRQVQMMQYSKQEARNLLGLKPDAFIIGNVARLVTAKGHQLLLEAFRQLERDNHCQLVIIGTGPKQQWLQQQIKAHHLEEKVLLLGYVKDAYRYMKAFDIFVLSSQREAFGVVLLEAMAAEVPIVSTMAEGIPEVLGEYPYLCPYGDAQVFAQCLQQVLDLPPHHLAMLINSLKRRLNDLFDIAPHYQQYHQLLDVDSHSR